MTIQPFTNRAWVSDENNKIYIKNDQLRRIAALLNEDVFCRIHRSYLININFLERIESLTKDRRIAVLKNKKTLPISRSGYDRLTALMQP